MLFCCGFLWGAWVVWYWLTIKVCGSKALSIKDATPITDRMGKVSLLFLYHEEAINLWILKMTAMMLGKKMGVMGDTVLGWIGTIYDYEIIYHQLCKKNIIICKDIHTFYMKKTSQKSCKNR